MLHLYFKKVNDKAESVWNLKFLQIQIENAILYKGHTG